MIRKGLKYILSALVAIVLYACAQINPLQGGPKDNFAPSIDSSGTYPLSGQTNFNAPEIVIKFNEYVALNNVNDNVIITPQLQNRPEITAKNKKVRITFNETLEENTTYTISFNHAITDITEKNDSIFQFVFSTGDYIDSLSVSGKVTDGFTNRGEEGFLVGLYTANTDVDLDSIPFKERPIYIAQTGANGSFQMNYLKAGDYYLFTIEDQNKNLKLDPAEKRGFLKEQRIHLGDGEIEPLQLLTYRPEAGEARIQTTRFTYPGRLEFILNNIPDTFNVTSSIDLLQETTEEKDSLVFWLKSSPGSKTEFIVNLNNELDTIKPLYKGIPDGKKTILLNYETNIEKGKLLPEQQLELIFTEPIANVNPEGIHFMDVDSNRINIEQFEIKNLRTLAFDVLGTTAEMVKVDSGAITSFYGIVNNNIPITNFVNREADYYGMLIVNVDTTFDTPVLVELLDNKNEVVGVVPFEQKMKFEKLLPGKYQLRLIFDANDDGKWTTGSLKGQRLPEKVIYGKEQIDVKSRWEKEVDWIIEN